MHRYIFKLLKSFSPQVTGFTAASVSSVEASVESVVDQLRSEGVPLGEAVGQLVSSVSSLLNSQANELNPADSQKVKH